MGMKTCRAFRGSGLDTSGPVDNCLCLATLRQRELYLLIADVLYTCLKGQSYFKASQKNACHNTEAFKI